MTNIRYFILIFSNLITISIQLIYSEAKAKEIGQTLLEHDHFTGLHLLP